MRRAWYEQIRWCQWAGHQSATLNTKWKRADTTNMTSYWLLAFPAQSSQNTPPFITWCLLQGVRIGMQLWWKGCTFISIYIDLRFCLPSLDLGLVDPSRGVRGGLGVSLLMEQDLHEGIIHTHTRMHACTHTHTHPYTEDYTFCFPYSLLNYICAHMPILLIRTLARRPQMMQSRKTTDG